jgi:hypothetical protein
MRFLRHLAVRVPGISFLATLRRSYFLWCLAFRVCFNTSDQGVGYTAPAYVPRGPGGPMFPITGSVSPGGLCPPAPRTIIPAPPVSPGEQPRRSEIGIFLNGAGKSQGNKICLGAEPRAYASNVVMSGRCVLWLSGLGKKFVLLIPCIS